MGRHDEPVAWIGGRDAVYARRGRFVDEAGRDVTSHVRRHVIAEPNGSLVRQLRRARDRGVDVSLPLDGRPRDLRAWRGERDAPVDLTLCHHLCWCGGTCAKKRRHWGRHNCSDC
jgi:hypothetical protein